jgi:probable HAF family extracellular repeat protein
MDINEHGQVVGHADTIEGFTRAIIWDEVNGMRSLGTIEGQSTIGRAINDQGFVVGFETGAGGFLWNPTDGMRRLPIAGRDINNLGEIVGDGLDGPAIWDQTNGSRSLVDLIPQDSGWDLEFAFSINDLGEIAGYGIVGGQVRGFLLTPIPEPTTAILIASSLALLSFWTLRRLNRRS